MRSRNSIFSWILFFVIPFAAFLFSFVFCIDLLLRAVGYAVEWNLLLVVGVFFFLALQPWPYGGMGLLSMPVINRKGVVIEDKYVMSKRLPK